MQEDTAPLYRHFQQIQLLFQVLGHLFLHLLMQILLRHTIRQQFAQRAHHYRVLLADLFSLLQIQASLGAFCVGF